MAKATKKDKEITLETVLWNCRVALRGVGSMEKNRDAVIGLAFLKFAGDKFDKRRAELLAQYGDIPVFLEKPSFYNAVNVFYLKDTARWSYIVKNAGANDIAVILDQAMADIEEANPSLKGALLQNFYATLGAPKEKTKALIDEVNKISETRFHEEDLIGRVYEYFLQIYAASGTKEDGEFYTPACVVKLIAEMIEPFSGTVYDPCCGSGGMFVQSHKFIERHQGNRTNISVIGQESVPDTWRLCKMNLAIRGISHDLGEKNASTFTDDQHKDRKFDFIMANPPFNLKGWRGEDEYHMDQLTQINGCDLKYFDKKQIQTTKAIREYLISHLDEKVSLEQLAKEAHLNLSVFHLVFSHIYGDTPYAYLKKYKMNLAAQWLSKDKMKIGDIALELGYSNASKFAKAFQSVYGMLPKDYRKNK